MAIVNKIKENKGLILTIVLSILFVIILIVFIVTNSKRDRKEGCFGGKRISDCLKVYDKYPKITFDKLNSNNILTNPQGINYRLKDFYIASSYMSSYPCGHTKDLVSYDSIKKILEKGARFLYFDVYFMPGENFNQNFYSSNAKIIVQSVIDGKRNVLINCGKKNQYLLLDDVFKLLKNNAWKGKEDYPLLVYLNILLPPLQSFEYGIFESINTHLKDRLLNPIYSFQNKNIADAPLKDLLGKVVILTNRKPINANLNEFVNGIINNETSNTYRYDMNQKIIDSGGVANLFVNQEDGINKCKNILYMVVTESTPNEKNVFSPKIDIKNDEPKEAFDFGIQIFCMNYQIYGENMKAYLTTELNPEEFKGKTFANSGFIRKPANMISLPTPPQVFFKQNPALGLTNPAVVSSSSYAPVKGGIPWTTGNLSDAP